MKDQIQLVPLRLEDLFHSGVDIVPRDLFQYRTHHTGVVCHKIFSFSLCFSGVAEDFVSIIISHSFGKSKG